MEETIVIDRRFRGPPDSANGGYAAGRLASFLTGPAEVSLRAPPPLERPLEVRRLPDGGVELREGDRLLAEAHARELTLAVPEPVGIAEAREASRRSHFRSAGRPFLQCFGCGPERALGDGLRNFVGPVEGRDVFAGPWTPHPSLPSSQGVLRDEIVWAALDCPSAAPVVPLGSPPHVLGRLAARVDCRVRVGDPHVVMAWALESPDGSPRKRQGAAAILTADGELCAASRAVWIERRWR